MITSPFKYSFSKGVRRAVAIVCAAVMVFSGPVPLARATDLGWRDLAPGEMSIYHHHDARTGRVLFSMASMVEPGTFPFDGMKRFSTPGLALFTQLPGARDGVEIYDAMLAAARGLAAALHGEVQDERHNKLTGQMEKHIREAIIEHRHRLKLQRSRR